MSSRPSGGSLRKQATRAKSRDPSRLRHAAAWVPALAPRVCDAGYSAGMTLEGSTATCSKGRPKIVPVLIFLFDQFNFPLPPPSLKTLLSRYRFKDVVEDFKIHQCVDPIFRGEAADEVVAMFVDSTNEIIRHADVERASRPTCKDVH